MRRKRAATGDGGKSGKQVECFQRVPTSNWRKCSVLTGVEARVPVMQPRSLLGGLRILLDSIPCAATSHILELTAGVMGK